jgi:hypothetical protein
VRVCVTSFNGVLVTLLMMALWIGWKNVVWKKHGPTLLQNAPRINLLVVHTGRQRWKATSSHNHNSSRHIQFASVPPTELQKERMQKIVQNGKKGHKRKKQWPRILMMFLQERQNYGLMELSTTLSQLARIPAFLRDDRDALPEILDTIANCIEPPEQKSATMLDPQCYASICNSIAKLQNRGGDCDSSAQRIIQHLSNPTFVQSFLNASNPQDIATVSRSLARLKRPDLLDHVLHQMDDECRKAIVIEMGGKVTIG